MFNLTPNMTYKPRVMRNSGNVVVNGSDCSIDS